MKRNMEHGLTSSQTLVCKTLETHSSPWPSQPQLHLWFWSIVRVYPESRLISRLNGFMIRLPHCIKERPLILLGNKARPSLATPGTMNCYQAGFPYFRNRGTPVSVENAHICLSAELNSFSLSSPRQSTLGKGVPSSVMCCFLPQGYSVFQKQYSDFAAF